MRIAEIEARELRVGDVVQINALCVWEVTGILRRTDKAVTVQYVWHDSSTAPWERGVIAPKRHRLSTFLTVVNR